VRSSPLRPQASNQAAPAPPLSARNHTTGQPQVQPSSSSRSGAAGTAAAPKKTTGAGGTAAKLGSNKKAPAGGKDGKKLDRFTASKNADAVLAHMAKW
jgi:hypothetical protein